MIAGGARVALLSLEPWDDVWRRNQHLATRLVRDGVIGDLIFVEPPRRGLALRAARRPALPGITVVTPPLVVPRRCGGHAVLALWLRRLLRDVDLLWVNDPVAGVGALTEGVRAVYDVTDDWRSMPQAPRDRARLVAAEDVLARRATTVVCSTMLADRWGERYGIHPTVVRNGVDTEAIRAAVPVPLDRAAPHAVYVGTLHANRIDVGLVEDLARTWPGTVHLVGPDALDPEARRQLEAAGVNLPGPVTSSGVASWLVSADVLICPHVVDDFTLSLDAIKSHEYLATDRPVVATASSGFQSIAAPGLAVVGRSSFVDAVVAATSNDRAAREWSVDWDVRTAEFGRVLTDVT